MNKDYTDRAVADLKKVVYAKTFETMTSEMIYRYLKEQMQIITFGDFLRRYIYEKMNFTEPFGEIPDSRYEAVIRDSFSLNRAPHAFTPVRSRWSSIIKRWLTCDTVKRETVFVLGFGFRMSDEDVSMFLTKAIKEQDFRFSDPMETVFWYCYHHGLPYSEAVRLLQEVGEESTAADQDEGSAYRSESRIGLKGSVSVDTEEEDFWKKASSRIRVYLSNLQMINRYLAYLKASVESGSEKTFAVFQELLERAGAAAGRITGSHAKQEPDSRPNIYDIEIVLCSGIPRTADKNLRRSSDSALCRQFAGKRMSRQHLASLLSRKVAVERFDLITLLFLIYAGDFASLSPKERCVRFTAEANQMLTGCGMMELYPVHPYESFVLMCLLSEEPLTVYNDVWEMSYLADEGEE